jgi:hypothetical protein
MTRCAATLLLFLAAMPGVRHFRYDRLVLNTPQQAQQTCVTLDPATFINAGPRLSSLRLYNGATETPYVINYAEPLQPLASNITPLNLGLRNGLTAFDAAMPDGSYRNLNLSIDAHDFLATVSVTGSQSQFSQTRSGSPFTSLGSYTIFDFTRQKLGRSTILHLPLSDFRYLHFTIDGPIHPDQITGLTTGRISAGAPQYVTVSATAAVQETGRNSVITLEVPPNIPVDRILFEPGPQPANFSRDVTITVAPADAKRERRERNDLTDRDQFFPVSTSGNLLRLHTIRNGHKIDEENLSIDPPTYAASFAPGSGTIWTITVHNQDDAPIDIRSVTLQMIARTLCFDAAPGAAYTLYYGDPALTAPHYDYAALFTPDKTAARASLGPALLNPRYQPRPDTRPFTEKHPALLWIALLAVIFLLGVIALRSAKHLRQH